MKTLACSVCLAVMGVAPVAADNAAPRSLRMRSKRLPGAAWSPLRWATRIAQAAPAPGDPPADPATTPAEPAAEPAAPALSDADLAQLAEQQAAKTEVIKVTGTLIDRKEVDSPSPMTIVDREKLGAAGMTNVGDILQKIPAQGNAINAQNNNGGDGSTRLNLRSIGSNRTLVLLNGRRVVASGLGADPSVDVGTIPLAMIERVEVLKDGASAIYGSDAIGGVVNLITRSNMNGTEAGVYTSTSSHRDGTNYDLSFVTGHSSTRGNITFSGGYQQQKAVMAGARDFGKVTYGYNFDCTPEMKAANRCTVLLGSPASPTGRINALPGNGPHLAVPGCTPTEDNPYCTADGNGGFRNFILPTATSLGDNYNFQPLNYLLTPASRVNLFSNGHYDITPHNHVFFEGQFNSRESIQQLAEEPATLGLFGTPISRDSIYNPFGADVVDYNRRLVEFGPRTFKQEVNTTRLVVGLDGTVPEDAPVAPFKNWKWEASYNYGRNDSTNATHGDLILSRLGNAVGPSFRDATGAHCGTPDKIIAGCVPLDLLHPRSGNITKDAIDYLTFTGTQAGFNEQHSAMVTASGKLVDLPNHGDISLALGGDYRFESGGQEPDPLTSTGDTTGSASAPTLGSYHAYEGFGELSVVPYAGGDLVKWAELDAAGRAYKYNTFGSGVTGKLSGLVRFAGGLAVRGTYGNAFRAPNIGELFAGAGDAFPLVEDPCDTHPPSSMGETKVLDPRVAEQCRREGVPANASFRTPQQRAKVGGNADLRAETGQVATAGVVYEPLRGLDFTVDYWHINIDHAITTLPPSTILSQCYEGHADLYCQMVTRNPVTLEIDHIEDFIRNVGSLATSGIDFSAGYQYRNGLGTFRHALEGTYLFKYNVDTGVKNPTTMKEEVIHGRGYFDLGVNPDLKLNLFTTWAHPSGVGAGFNVRFIDSFQECDDNNCNDPGNGRRDVAASATGDVFVSYALSSGRGATSITAGVNNVTNAQPPTIYNGPALNTDESAYNFLGRQFYVRLGQLF